MSSSQKTPYYTLSQFQDADKPTWRGDYNGDMSKIDTGMQDIKTSAIDAKTIAQSAESSINEVRRDYLKKTDAQNTYTTKTELNDTKTTIENNADNKFVAKETYTATIGEIKTDIKTASHPKKNIVVFGDSWTVVQNGAFINALRAEYDVESVHSYGVGGHTIQDIMSQIQAYKSDTTFDHDNVTNVIVLAGTNNVFWDNAVTHTDALNVAKSIRNAFPDPVQIDYFPDNSRTINSGRNHRYGDILQAFAIYMAVHPEFLWIVGFNNGEFFKGNDTDGVQHLSEDGYKQLAHWIYSTINGSYFGDVAGSAIVQVTPGPNSDVTFPAQNVRVRYTGVYTHILGHIANVEWAEKEGINKNNPKIEIDFNTSISPNTLPVQLQSDMVTIFAGGLYTGYFNNNNFRSSNKNTKTTEYTFNDITIDAYTRASYNLL